MSIEIRGMDQLFRKLDRVAAISVLEPPMQRSVLRLQRDMANYPPAPPRSTYRRTGTLGRRWTVRVLRVAGGLEGHVGNNVRYAPFVQSRQFQRPVHRRTGWLTDRQAIERNRAAITQDFQQAMIRALR